LVRPRGGATERWSLRLHPEVDKLLDKVAKERGISKNSLVESIILEWAYRNGYNKILHANIRNGRIAVWDFLLDETVHITYVEPEHRLYCENCKTYDCGHIWAIMHDKDLRKKIKKEGWIIAEIS